MDEVVRELDQLWFRARDYCDQPEDSAAQRLQKEIRAVHAEAKQGKSPDYLFEKVKELQRMLDDFRHSDEVYDFKHTDDMHDRCEDIKKHLRKLS